MILQNGTARLILHRAHKQVPQRDITLRQSPKPDENSLVTVTPPVRFANERVAKKAVQRVHGVGRVVAYSDAH